MLSALCTALSPDGETLYVADNYNHRIRKIDTSNGLTTTLAGSGTGTFADGTGTAARFDSPRGVAVSGGTLYVADTSNKRIRKIDTSGGDTTTLAGSDTYGFADGTGTAASFKNPRGVAVSPDGGRVYVADNNNHRIRTIDTSDGVTTTLAGSATSGFADGTGAAASFNYPYGVAVSPNGMTVYVADRTNRRIRQVTA